MSQNMVAEAEIICKQSVTVLDMKYHLCVATQDRSLPIDVSSSPTPSPSIREVRVSESVSAESSPFESVRAFFSLFFFHQLGVDGYVCRMNFGNQCNWTFIKLMVSVSLWGMLFVMLGRLILFYLFMKKPMEIVL